MNKLFLTTCAALFAFSLSAQPPMAATDITAADVQAFVKSLPRDSTNDRPIRIVDVGGYKVGIYAVFRPSGSTGAAVAHETKITEVYEIMEGAGTLVTGGTIVDAKEQKGTAMGFANLSGPRIEGGTSRRVSKGDIIIIPGHVPHWWSHLEGDVTYLIVRPDPDGVLGLK
jgi:mannose-6-phosphate isomerase-like protein (cupin superfamily)